MRVYNARNTFPWLCWISAALIYAFQYGVYAAPAGFSHALREGLNLSSTELGFFTSAFLYSYVIMQVPAGVLLDKFGARKTLLFSMLVILIGLILLIASEEFTLAFISRLLMGLGGGAAFVCAIYLGRSWLPVAIFPVVLGVTEAMSSIGEYSFMNISALLNEIMDWRLIVTCFFLLGLALYLLIYFYVKDRKYIRFQQKKCEKISYLKIIKDPRLWLIGLSAGCNFANYMAVASFWQVPFLIGEDHINNVHAVFINGFVLIGFTIGCPTMGFLTRFFSKKKLILTGSVIELIALVIANNIPGYIHIQEVALFVAGFATANVLLTFALIREFTPTTAYGFSSGFVNMFFGLVGLILLPIIGYIYDSTHYDVSITILPVLIANLFAILCYISFLYIHRKKGQSHEKYIPE